MDFSLSSMNVLTTVIKSLRKKYNKLLTLYAAPCFSKPAESPPAMSRSWAPGWGGNPAAACPGDAGRAASPVPPTRDVTRGWDHPAPWPWHLLPSSSQHEAQKAPFLTDPR